MLTFRNHLSVPSSKAGTYPAFQDGKDRWFRNVGMQKSEAGDTPKRLLAISKLRRKFEIKNTLHVSGGLSVRHQESKTVHTESGICYVGSVAAC
jgi:hypothetical protein